MDNNLNEEPFKKEEKRNKIILIVVLILVLLAAINDKYDVLSKIKDGFRINITIGTGLKDPIEAKHKESTNIITKTSSSTKVASDTFTKAIIEDYNDWAKVKYGATSKLSFTGKVSVDGEIHYNVHDGLLVLKYTSGKLTNVEYEVNGDSYDAEHRRVAKALAISILNYMRDAYNGSNAYAQRVFESIDRSLAKQEYASYEDDIYRVVFYTEDVSFYINDLTY